MVVDGGVELRLEFSARLAVEADDVVAVQASLAASIKPRP
jgi:hypothetical protein